MTAVFSVSPSILERLTSASLPKAPPPGYHSAVGSLAGLVGHECKTPNFTQAVQLVTERYGLPLDTFDVDTLGLLLTGLSRATRFGKSLHISKERRENSATHSLACVPLHDKLCGLAGLRSIALEPEVRQLRLVPAVGFLLHDMGEMYGEFSSLDQRSRDAKRENDYSIERDIFEHAARWAIATVRERDYGAFYAMQSRVIEAAGILGNHSHPTEANVRAALRANPPPALEPQEEKVLSRYLDWFDLVETPRTFFGCYNKLVEHLQGTRHATLLSAKHASYSPHQIFHRQEPSNGAGLDQRFRTNPPFTVPMAYGDHVRLGAVLRFTEYGLGELFTHATTPATHALAKVVRDAVYQGTIEFLLGSLYVWNRAEKRSSPFITEEWLRKLDDESVDDEVRATIAEAITRHQKMEQLRLLGELRQPQQRTPVNEAGELSDMLTRGDLVRLYARALQVGYVPTKGEAPLALLKTLPGVLRGFHSVPRHAALAAAMDAVSERQRQFQITD